MAKANVTVASVSGEEANAALIELTTAQANMRSALIQTRERNKLLHGEVAAQRAQIEALVASVTALKAQVGKLALKVSTVESGHVADRRTAWNDAVASLREQDGDPTAYYDPADIRKEMARLAQTQEVKAPMTPAFEDDVAF